MAEKAPTVWAKIDEQLHDLLDMVEPVRAAIQSWERKSGLTVDKFGDAFEKMGSYEQSLVDVVRRLDLLDKQQPVGSKVYIPRFGQETAKGRGLVEGFFADVARMKFGVAPKMFEKKDFQYRVIDGVPSQARADQTEGTTTAGGFLVPEELLPEVIALIGEAGVARRICRIIPMTRKDMKMPTRNTGPLVYWPGEGVKPTQTAVSLLRPELNSKTMLALDEISEELDADSIVPMASLLVDLFTEAVALEEDYQLFSSSVPFSGVFQTTSVNDVTMTSGSTDFSDITYDDLVNLRHGVNSKVVNNGVYVMHQDQVGNMLKLKDKNDNPIWRDAPYVMGSAAQGPAGSILGHPYYTTNAMPNHTNSAAGRYFMAYGDFKRYWALGDRMQMQIDISMEAGFTTSMVGVLAQ